MPAGHSFCICIQPWGNISNIHIMETKQMTNSSFVFSGGLRHSRERIAFLWQTSQNCRLLDPLKSFNEAKWKSLTHFSHNFKVFLDLFCLTTKITPVFLICIACRTYLLLLDICWLSLQAMPNAWMAVMCTIANLTADLQPEAGPRLQVSLHFAWG